jgi:hypothetical protein
MIYKSVLQSLSDDEISILLYVTNFLHHPGFNIEVNENILSAYKKDALMWICTQHRDKVLPEHLLTYDTMIAKLNRHPGVINNDTTETAKPDEQQTGQPT